jgi:ankyrin repeat protein/L-ascorbate metabolism protein UlaG (beta-lactamase superfamily)
MTRRTLTLVVVAVQLIAVQLLASEIHQAVESGNVEQTRALLEANPALVNEPDTAQSLPLHLAAYNGQTATIELLLSLGADINVGDRENTTALTIAAMRNHMDAVRLLTEKGGLVTSKDSNGNTALLSAARSKNTEMVRYLLDHGASLAEVSNRGSNCLHIATSIGADSLVTFLLTKEMDINARNNSGYNALFFAIANGYTGIATRLIEHGADVQYRNEDGETLLHVAARRGDTAIAAELVAAGLSIDARDNLGWTPLTSVGWGTLEMTQWLLDRGADVNARTDTTLAPLSVAIFGGNIDIVRLMVNKGADVNWCRQRGDRPLQQAVMRGAREIARILLENGAEVDFTDPIYGRTMLHMAAISGDSIMAQLLLDHGAKIEPQDQNGKSPLYYAVHYSNPSVAALLTARGVTLSQPETDIRPLDMRSHRMGEKEAMVWYLNNSAWAIKTANHFLVFDYFVPPSNPDRPCLANGRIDPQEIKDLEVTVFSSHEHGDHYDTTIFAWRDVIPNITYVLGHQPSGVPEDQYTTPRTDQTIDGMRIRTIAATDAGVGYLVEVDGLVIFHAGDHANGEPGLHAPYTDEIDYLASLGVSIDLAFMPIHGCSLGTPESVREGVFYALNKLQPRVFFPQHSMNAEYQLREFADDLKENGYTVQVGCAENGGDCFHYRDHRVL